MHIYCALKTAYFFIQFSVHLRILQVLFVPYMFFDFFYNIFYQKSHVMHKASWTELSYHPKWPYTNLCFRSSQFQEQEGY